MLAELRPGCIGILARFDPVRKLFTIEGGEYERSADQRGDSLDKEIDGGR